MIFELNLGFLKGKWVIFPIMGVFEGKMRDFPNNWGFLKGKWVIFELNLGFLKGKWVNFA